jgi:hypothetical protein
MAFDHQLIGIIAGVVAFAAIVPYIWDIIGGITKPNLVSYFIWTLLQSIAIVAQFQAGASWSVYFLMGSTLSCAIIFLLALTKCGYKEYGWIDATALILAVVAIGVLIFTHHPVYALLLTIFADALGAIPTVVKTRKYPYTENKFAWTLTVISAMLGILATEKLDVANLAYPVFLLAESVLILAIAVFTKTALVCRWGRGCR